MEEKSALDNGYHKTVVYLTKKLEVGYEKRETMVTTPSQDGKKGISKTFAKWFSDGDANVLIWKDCGCDVVKIVPPKIILKHRLSVPGIKIEYNDEEQTISWITKGKDNATRNWKAVKEELIRRDIPYRSYRCEPYTPKKKSINCYDDTILDNKYKE